jgi:hypothetical protein
MVTTRSQEKGLSTPVSSSKIEVIVPSITRSTPRTTDSPSTTRKTRSTPRLSDSTHKSAREMGTSASKAEPALSASNNHTDGALANERHENVENTAIDPAQELAQQNPLLLQEQPTANSQPNTQESSTIHHDLIPLSLKVDPDDGGSTNLPERLKLSPPTSAAISLNTHKRFRSEEPEEPEEPIAPNNLRVEGPSHSTIDSFTTPGSSDESEGAPEVVSIVSRKSTNRSSKGRKRRRLEEDVVGGLKSPKDDQTTVTPAREQLDFPKQTVNINTSVDTTQQHGHTTGEPSTLQQSKESVGQKLLDGDNLESGALESGLNISAMIPTTIGETDVTLPGTLGSEKDAGTSNISGDVIPSLSGNDAMLETGLAETGFKVPLFTRHEAKISGLNVESVNTTVLDDAESGSHTEAGSATLTNNSFATVPEHQSISYGETTAAASADTKQKNLAENISLSFNQEAPPKHTRAHHVRPRKAMPQPTRELSSLQHYRQRLLNRNPRTNAWGPPGFRRTRFVGV